jgi:hypothetical protein
MLLTNPIALPKKTRLLSKPADSGSAGKRLWLIAGTREA